MNLHEFFHKEVKPALGCTEPGAVAFAAASAARHISGKVLRLDMDLSLSMFKNGRDVGIPGSGGLRGSRLAAAMGALGGDPQKGLMALDGVPQGIAEQANAMVQANMIREQVVDDVPPVYAAITVHSDTGEQVLAVISGRHDRIERICRDNKVDGVLVHYNRSCKPWSGYMAEMQRRFTRDLGIPCAGFDGDQADPRNFNEAQYETRVQGLVEAMQANQALKEGAAQ